jgi:hypothetical protein
MIPMPEEKIQQSRIKTLWRLNINYSIKQHKFELPDDNNNETEEYVRTCRSGQRRLV